MLKCIKGFLAGVLVTGLVLGWFAYTHMVVRTADGHRVVAKLSSSFQRFYVDVREWGVLDYVRNRDVSDALAQDGWDHAKDALKDAAGKAEQSLQEAAGKAEQSLQDAKARLKEKLGGK
jgi:hypothetical protein